MSVDTTPDTGRGARPGRSGLAPVARAIGGLLCLAAGLKLYDLFDSYGEGIGWTLSLIGSSIELLVGAALVLGIWPSVFVPAGGLLFVLLTATALIGTTRGVALCGCLGAVPVPPWIPLVVDAASAVALLWGARRLGGRRFVAMDAACIGAFFLGMTIGGALYPHRLPATKNLSEDLIESSREFAIEPDRFRGRPFSLGKFIRIDADLSRGRWKVILTRPGCRKCDRMLRSGACRPEGDESVAVVVARGKGETGRDWTLPEGCRAVLGELDPNKTWDFEPPMVFRLDDRKVVATR